MFVVEKTIDFICNLSIGSGRSMSTNHKDLLTERSMATNHKNLSERSILHLSPWTALIISGIAISWMAYMFIWAVCVNVHDALTRIGLLKDSLEHKRVSMENIKDDLSVRRTFAITAKEQSNIFSIEEQGSSIKIFINIFWKILTRN